MGKTLGRDPSLEEKNGKRRRAVEICEPAVLLSELVREMLPGSRVKQGQNLLFLHCCPFAADVALQSLPHSSLLSHLCPTLQCQASAPNTRPAWRALCAALVVLLKGVCNLYYCFPRSDGVFWRNVHYFRCSVR